jgi:hypothetical protein
MLTSWAVISPYRTRHISVILYHTVHQFKCSVFTAFIQHSTSTKFCLMHIIYYGNNEI